MLELRVFRMRGILRCGGYESTCNVTQHIAGQGDARYYTSAEILDNSVSPALEDGTYEFSYLGEGAPPSRRKPPRY